MYFDIGAYTGQWTIANLCFANKIIAVEANPDTFNSLKKNTEELNKVIQLNYAVCDSKDETIDFYKACVLSTINKDWLTHEKSRFYNASFEKITSKTISLDKLIEIYGVPSLIKIDVEGGEFNCIRSLTQKVDNLCFEWAVEFNDITFSCIQYLITLGFSKFYLQYNDAYTFRPNESDYVDHQTICEQLNICKKDDWGMIWCK